MGPQVNITKAMSAIRQQIEGPEGRYGWDAVYGEGAAGIPEQVKADMAKARGERR